jgi:hypothetical protein
LAQYRAKLSGGRDTPFRLAGAPTSGAGGSFVNMAGLGSLLVDYVNAKLYIATAVGGGSVTWTVVGLQA